MRGLLKYAFVLALGIAIGAYIVLDNIVSDNAEQGEIAARSEAAPPATPESIEEEELEYSVAKRLASLDGWRAFLAAHPNGAYAQSARAEIARRFGASRASADEAASEPALPPTDNEQGGALSEAAGPLAPHQPAPAKAERLLLAGKASASGVAEPSGAASSETRAAVPATDAAGGAKLAALGKDENETAHPAAPLASADTASLSDAICKRDEDRLVRLRSTPSADEALRFEKQLGCEKLRPQLQRLMESLDFSAPEPPPPPAPADTPHPNLLLGQTCASERSALDRLRQEPTAEAAGLFWREMQCEGLRPQVRLLLESLNVAPDSVGSAAPPGESAARRAVSDPPAAMGMDSPACRRETAELNRVRATPDLGDAKRFASALTCDALRPQVARLLESFGD